MRIIDSEIMQDPFEHHFTVFHADGRQQNQILRYAVTGKDISPPQGVLDGIAQLPHGCILMFFILYHLIVSIGHRHQTQINGLAAAAGRPTFQMIDFFCLASLSPTLGNFFK